MRVKPIGIGLLLLILIFLISTVTILTLVWRCRGNRCVNAPLPAPSPATSPAPTSPPQPQQAEYNDLIYVEQPLPNSVISSPLVVTGAARGSWYFEASFPIRLLDGNGRERAVKPVQAQGEWMTTEYVPFLVRLEFTPPATDTGTLVLEKDNPSGLPEHAAELRIPVRFR